MEINKLDTLMNDLKQLKDELIVQAKLGKTEAQDELDKLEPLYEDLKMKLDKIADVAGDTASELKAATELGIQADSMDDVSTTLEMAGEELKEAYGKIKKILS